MSRLLRAAHFSLNCSFLHLSVVLDEDGKIIAGSDILGNGHESYEHD